MTEHFPDITTLVPHTGNMCLLSHVVCSSDQDIVCAANSHRDPANPLRHQGQLSVQAGIEYAGQAIAAHSNLLGLQAGDHAAPPARGVMAVLSEVSWSVNRLDDILPDLEIRATCIAALPQAKNYRFALYGGTELLLQGEMTVALHGNPT